MPNRHIVIQGIVTRGEGWGSRIGYPTANIERPRSAILPVTSGVYVCWVTLDAQKKKTVDQTRFKGLLVVGVPGFFVAQRKVEVHIVDFRKNITGQKLSCTIVEKLRPIKKFKHVDDMIAQIKEDIKEARRILENLF